MQNGLSNKERLCAGDSPQAVGLRAASAGRLPGPRVLGRLTQAGFSSPRNSGEPQKPPWGCQGPGPRFPTRETPLVVPQAVSHRHTQPQTRCRNPRRQLLPGHSATQQSGVLGQSAHSRPTVLPPWRWMVGWTGQRRTSDCGHYSAGREGKTRELG